MPCPCLTPLTGNVQHGLMGCTRKLLDPSCCPSVDHEQMCRLFVFVLCFSYRQESQKLSSVSRLKDSRSGSCVRVKKQHHISKISARFCRQKGTLSVVNSLEMYKAQITQAVFGWSTQQIHATNLNVL